MRRWNSRHCHIFEPHWIYEVFRTGLLETDLKPKEYKDLSLRTSSYHSFHKGNSTVKGFVKYSFEKTRLVSGNQNLKPAQSHDYIQFLDNHGPITKLPWFICMSLEIGQKIFSPGTLSRFQVLGHQVLL